MSAPIQHSKPVLAICLEYPISLPGGVSVLVRKLVSGLSDQFTVILVSPDSTETMQGIPDFGGLGAHHTWLGGPHTKHSAQSLANALIQFGVQIAHFHSGGNYGWGNHRLGTCPIPYLNRKGIKCFHTIHLVVSILDGFCGPKRPLWQKLLLFPLGYLAKLHQLKHTTDEIAVSQHDLRKVMRWYPSFRQKHRYIYHSTLDENTPDPPKPELRKPIILSVGHVAYRKGQHVLARAFSELAPHYPEWQLWIAGHNAEIQCWKEIEAIRDAGGLQNRIVLLGARQDAASLMREASIFVQPSKWEALGLALQEALFEGCACIGSEVGGIPELITDQSNGELVPPNDPTALAQSLKSLLDHKEKQFAYANRARRSVIDKKMTASCMLRSHLQMYEQSTNIELARTSPQL